MHSNEYTHAHWRHFAFFKIKIVLVYKLRFHNIFLAACKSRARGKLLAIKYCNMSISLYYYYIGQLPTTIYRCRTF